MQRMTTRRAVLGVHRKGVARVAGSREAGRKEAVVVNAGAGGDSFIGSVAYCSMTCVGLCLMIEVLSCGCKRPRFECNQGSLRIVSQTAVHLLLSRQGDCLQTRQPNNS